MAPPHESVDSPTETVDGGIPTPRSASAEVPPAEGVAPGPRTAPGGPASAPAAGGETGRPAATLSFRELATYGSTVVGLLCLIKVYAVAHYSTTTTTALITAAPEQILLGTLAIAVYPIMAVLTYGALWSCFTWHRRIPREAWLPFLALVVFTALMTPIHYHLVGVGLLLVTALVELLVRYGLRRTDPGRPGSVRRILEHLRGHVIIAFAGLLLGLGFLDTLDSPWTSAEVFLVKEPVVRATQELDRGAAGEVELAVSTEPVVGYLVEESFTGFTVLDAETRYVMSWEKTQVAGRYTCHYVDTQLHGTAPLLEWLRGNPYRSPNSDCTELAAELRTTGVSGHSPAESVEPLP